MSSGYGRAASSWFVVGSAERHLSPQARALAIVWTGAVAGGVLYNVGVIFFAIRWANPWPRTFGYHEFFHVLTAAAAVSHYVAVWFVVV